MLVLNTLSSARGRSRVALLCAAVVGLLPAAPAASAATRLVVPLGRDAGQCTLTPCASFAYAYARSADGDVISVGPGRWNETQRVPHGSKRVTFKGVAGNKVTQLLNDADNVTFDGLDVDGDGAKVNTFYDSGNLRWTFKNGRIGNVVDEKGALLGGQDDSTAPAGVVLDNVVFHDVLQRGAEVHNECLMTHSPGITIRNSTFVNCATMDVSLGVGWTGQRPYGNVTLENNVFGHSVNGSSWHYYGLAWYLDMVRNARVVNNTFENAVYLETDHAGSPPYSGVWANNIGTGWGCLQGVVFRNNVGERCGASDTSQPFRSLASNWISPALDNFRLRPGSTAIGAASPVYAPARDRDGFARDARPDAGAHEFGAGPTIGGPPASTRGWRLGSARLRPRVICRRARRGCPASARLRLDLARAARVLAQVRRVRRGGTARRVRTLAPRSTRRHKALRIRAKWLRRGRYRIRLRATDLAGRVSAPVVRTLRVR